MEDTLESKINLNPVDDQDKKLVHTVLKIIDNSSVFMEEFLDKVDRIAKLYEDSYALDPNTQHEKLPAFILFQTVFSFISRMKPIDVMVKRDGVDEEHRRIVSEGIGAVIKKSGFVNMLRDDFGGFYQQLTYGDFFAMVGSDELGLPEFRACNLVGIYTDPNTVTLRNKSSGGQATRVVVVFEYDWDEAISLFPEIETKATKGDLPSTQAYEQYYSMDNKKWEQEAQAKERRIQVGFYYDIGKIPYFGIIAGASGAIIQEVKGEDYPFYFGDKDAEMDEREFYIPLLQWMLFPTIKGLFNAGFGHVCYRLSTLYRQLGNKAIIQVLDNIDPVRILNLPQQQAGGFLAKLKNAQEAIKKGGKGVVTNAFGPGEQGAGMGAMETMTTQQVTADFERLMAFFDKILTGFGINLQRVLTDPNKTATAIEFEQEGLGDVISQIQEQNASTYEFAFKVVIDMIRKNIEDEDDTPLDVNKKMFVPELNQEIEVPFTLGMLAEELRAADWDIVVNSRTGVYPSKTLDKFYLQSAINDLIALGDVEGAMELMNKKHALNGINIRKRQPQQNATKPEELGAEPTAAKPEPLAISQ
jgi:hypothetical protein